MGMLMLLGFGCAIYFLYRGSDEIKFDGQPQWVDKTEYALVQIGGGEPRVNAARKTGPVYDADLQQRREYGLHRAMQRHEEWAKQERKKFFGP